VLIGFGKSGRVIHGNLHAWTDQTTAGLSRALKKKGVSLTADGAKSLWDSESTGKPDVLQTLRDKARHGKHFRASVWSASGLPCSLPHL
jgi:hypothetical protein